jgi:hypothetical protein
MSRDVCDVPLASLYGPGRQEEGVTAAIDARCSEPGCWCHELPAVRTIPSTGERYTVQALPWAGVPWLYRYLYLPGVAA